LGLSATLLVVFAGGPALGRASGAKPVERSVAVTPAAATTVMAGSSAIKATDPATQDAGSTVLTVT